MKRWCSRAPRRLDQAVDVHGGVGVRLGRVADRAAREEPGRPGRQLACVLVDERCAPARASGRHRRRSRGRMRRTRSRPSRRRARRPARQGRAPPACGRPRRRSHPSLRALLEAATSTLMHPPFTHAQDGAGRRNRHRCRHPTWVWVSTQLESRRPPTRGDGGPMLWACTKPSAAVGRGPRLVHDAAAAVVRRSIELVLASRRSSAASGSFATARGSRWRGSRTRCFRAGRSRDPPGVLVGGGMLTAAVTLRRPALTAPRRSRWEPCSSPGSRSRRS